MEAEVVVESAELIVVIAGGESGPCEDEGRPKRVVEEDGDGGARRRVVVVENLGGGEGQCRPLCTFKALKKSGSALAKEKAKSSGARRAPEKLVVEVMETSREAKME